MDNETETGKQDGIDVNMSEERWTLLEMLASQAHNSWSKWMRHVFLHTDEWARIFVFDPEDGLDDRGGSLIMSPTHVARWARQMCTPFDMLNEDEQKSDYEEAAEYLRIFDDYQERLAKTRLTDDPNAEIAENTNCMWCNRKLDYSERFVSQPSFLILCEQCFNERRRFMHEWANISPFGELDD